jgi:hypothetical protein
MKKLSTNKVRRVPYPIMHTFRRTQYFSTVSHYDLSELIGGNTLLTDQISISRNRNFSKPDPEYYLSPRSNSFSVNLIGLYTTAIDGILIGYIRKNHKKVDTILVQLTDQERTVKIYYFKKYHSKDIRPLLSLLMELSLEDKGK